jgi:hypothetical protein
MELPPRLSLSRLEPSSFLLRRSEAGLPDFSD